MVIPQLTSRIDKVKVYAAGATVTRIAQIQLSSGKVPEKVEIPGIPLALDDSSVRVRVEAGEGIAAIVTDVRIGLAVPPRQETQQPLADEAIREAAAEVQRIEDIITLIDNEITVLLQLEVPDRPEGEEGKAPPPSPMGARLALANFSGEQIRDRIQEKRQNQEKLRKAQEHLKDLEQKRSLASNAKEIRPNELRKTVIIGLSYEGQGTIAGQRLIVEYFVPGARWTPSYVCRLDSRNNTAAICLQQRSAIALRALICQCTGEDWSGVSLELSTAQPLTWCELPELPSLRLGRIQPIARKSGWRLPPIGAEILFEDYDRQKQVALAAVRQRHLPVSTDFSSPRVQPLPELDLKKIIVESPPEPTVQFEESMLADEVDSTSGFSSSLAREIVPKERRMRRATSSTLAQSLSAPMGEAKSAAIPRGAAAKEKARSRGSTEEQEETSTSLLAYSLMRMGAADKQSKRGKLSLEQQHQAYLEILQRQDVVVSFNLMTVLQQAVSAAQSCLSLRLPPGGINVRQVAGSFDYAYSADGRVDVPSDGQFHSVGLTIKSTDVDVRYVVVPREDTNVFRIAQLRNPLDAPLLAGSADVYVDGEYILSTNIATVPPQGQMELGLGVEQAIKVARNTSYQEARSGETLVAFNELRHRIVIDIANPLSREARIEVRERIPIPDEDAKVDVDITQVSPMWEKYEQEERGKPIQGGYRWQVKVPGGEQKTLTAEYTIKTFVDSELVDGNRREG